jgi:2-octaprenylphenol hydroxylase
MSDRHSDCDIAIVGAGIAGCALATRLAPLGWRIALLDGAPLPGAVPVEAHAIAAVDPRVSALNAASRALLQDCGAWEAIPASARGAYRAMRVWEEDGTGAIGFEAADVGASELGHIVENRWIIASLLRVLTGEPQIQLLGGERLQALELAQGGHAGALLGFASGRRLTAKLVVGADGAQSAVRALAGIDASVHDCAQQAIVATIRTAAPHRHTAWQRFLRSGPLALLPLATLPGERACSIVWSADTPVARELMALDDREFAARLGDAAERCAGEVLEVSRRHAFPLRQQHARNYGAAAVALVGDAAHVVHPLAGQGINLGLADVRVLAEELRRAQARGLPPGAAEPLARYARRRRTENALMLEAMRGFQQLFADDRPVVRLVRNLGLGAVDRAAPLKRLFMRQAMGV